MTTLGEEQTTIANWMDSIETAAANTTDWTDVATGVGNSGSDNTWQNNAVVIKHDPTGKHLMFVPTDDNQQQNYVSDQTGIRMVVFDSWDGSNNAPSGNSNLDSAYTADDNNIINDSPNVLTEGDVYSGNYTVGNIGIQVSNNQNQETRQEVRDFSLTHYTSIDSTGLYVGAWNTTDSDGGIATTMAFRHLSNKFWSDGHEDWVIAQEIPRYNYRANYAWQWSDADGRQQNKRLGVLSGVGERYWGIINSFANKDDFFFRWHPLYENRSQNEPIGYIRGLIQNHETRGAAHGDTITYNGNTYKVIKQYGANQSDGSHYAIRFE